MKCRGKNACAKMKADLLLNATMARTKEVTAEGKEAVDRLVKSMETKVCSHCEKRV